jgi:uncharacterized phage-associated protein
MASVHDVAAYILKKRGAMSTMKLQKLCYYSQGWSLAWDEKPLFEEPIRAWANGPVVYELFDAHRGQFRVHRWPDGNPDNLTKDERETVDAVLFAYGNLTGQQLSDKSHAERPWIEARAGMPGGRASSAVIELDTMQDFFGALAMEEADDLSEADEFDGDTPGQW